MKSEEIVDALADAARQLGWEVRFERGNFRGGPCRIDDERVIMLNKRHSPDVQQSILAESLHGEDLDQIFLQPAVRTALEEAWERLDTVQEQS